MKIETMLAVLLFFVFEFVKSQTDSSPVYLSKDNTLMFGSPICHKFGFSKINSEGYLSVIANDSKIQSFSMDVGLNRGRVLFDDWLAHNPSMFGIGIDGNYELITGAYHKREFRPYIDRAMLIWSAVSLQRGTIEMSVGAGWPVNKNTPVSNDGLFSDVGSIYKWSDSRKEEDRKRHQKLSQDVTLLRLDDLLRFVPPPTATFAWDTLKIDIQGADVEAVISAGDYIKNFVCIVGEFQTDHYAVPDEVTKINYHAHLVEKGFKKVYSGEGAGSNQVYINLKYKDDYVKNADKFNCHRVYDTRGSNPEEATPEVFIKYLNAQN